MRLTFIGRHLDLAILSRLALLAGCAIIFSLGATATSSAQDIESVKTGLAAKQCPAAEIDIINADDRCNLNGSATKECDRRFPAASAAWQNCYYGIQQCRKQVDEDNRVIYMSNEVFRRCHQGGAASSTPQPAAPKGAPAQKAENPAGSSTASDLVKRLQSQQQANTNMESVRKQQDARFTEDAAKQIDDDISRRVARDEAKCERERQLDERTSDCEGARTYQRERGWPAEYVREYYQACKGVDLAVYNRCMADAKGDNASAKKHYATIQELLRAKREIRQIAEAEFRQRRDAQRATQEMQEIFSNMPPQQGPSYAPSVNSLPPPQPQTQQSSPSYNPRPSPAPQRTPPHGYTVQ